MRAIRTGLTALVTVATLAGSVTPAMARGGWGGGRHHDRHDGFDFGDFLLGGLLIGTVAVLAGSKNQGTTTTQDDGEYRASTNGDDNADYATNDTATSDGQGGIGTEDAAVDACAVAARDKASVDGGYAEVKSIETVSSVTNGWDVHGTLNHRSGYRNAAATSDGFTCTVRGGWVSGVDLATAS